MAVINEHFPATRHSVVAGVRSADAEVRARSFGTLVEAYWRPVYKYVRIRWRASPEDAEDLTQSFFARAFEKNYFSRYDPELARFRTYVRVCLDGFVANEMKAAARIKRGGGARMVSIDGADFPAAEGELCAHDARLLADAEAAAAADVDEYFHREWVRSLFANAVTALRAFCEATGRQRYFEVFARYDLIDGPEERPSYAAIAAELAITSTQVTNYLSFARREFRRLVLETMREMTGSEEEFRAEARELLGVDP